ncbi:DUF6622 family protein [Paraburkholderia acidisoli]|uniref:DUF1453 domain-containing protein n=1 Tax=Paraburkholderia acidisoli TaxID=2571748 RepID=A0A7Z2GRJ1_9BURK|nr:DUF6622 family protein [Paraburkholderia acidisoli]QGZ66647.1 hypothetical protein FAZ98_33375 [Paraburkholderia acidisoli]
MSFQAILQGTPTWVWVLLVFLLSRGVKALKGGTAPLSRLALVPAIFAVWGATHLLTDPFASWAAALAWLAAVCAGIAGGLHLARRSGFSVDPVARTVTLPGSAVPLVLIVVIFAAKFWLGVAHATVTDAAAHAQYATLGAAVSGVVAGIFAGRFLSYVQAMRNAVTPLAQS